MGVSMNDILRYVQNNKKCKNKIIILDCCHSSAICENNESCESSTISEGLTILAACKSDEYSIEVNGHGIFTNLLINALSGEAANLKGQITPGSIYSYIDQALGMWEQRPVFKTNITQFVPIRTVTPPISNFILQKIVDYFPDPDSEYRLNPSFEVTNSTEYEHSKIEPYAQEKNVDIFKNLQKLVSVGLVVPVEEEHMYYAAMNSKSCKLTSLGHHYWKLIDSKKMKEI